MAKLIIVINLITLIYGNQSKSVEDLCISDDRTCKMLNSNKLISNENSCDNQKDTIMMSDQIDSVIVTYWRGVEANEYRYCYSNEIMQVNSEYTIWCYSRELHKFIEHSIFKRTIVDKHTIRKFKKYINKFYIDKDRSIVQRKIKRKFIVSTDYSWIDVIGYKNKEKVFNVKTQLGEDAYDVYYHPEFIEFCRFLDKLIESKCDGE